MTVSVKAGLPAAALAGESDVIDGVGLLALMAKASALEVPPPGEGLMTATLALPALDRSDLGTTAVSCVLLTYVVVRRLPLQETLEVETKSLPTTLSCNAGLPAAALVGESEVIDGTGFLARRENAAVADRGPSGAGLTTVTMAPSTPASVDAGTRALSWVLLMKLVGSGAPFHSITELGRKSLPCTRTVIGSLLVAALGGDSDDIEGGGFATAATP
jgi:hypothetical protein